MEKRTELTIILKVTTAELKLADIVYKQNSRVLKSFLFNSVPCAL